MTRIGTDSLQAWATPERGPSKAPEKGSWALSPVPDLAAAAETLKTLDFGRETLR
jgi:hypothetical protein